MKVLFLSPTGALGGAEIALLTILGTLRESKPAWQLHLISAEDGPLVDEARLIGAQARVLAFPDSIARLGDAGAGGPAGTNVSRLSLLAKLAISSGAALAYKRQLQREITRIGPEVVHSNGLKMHLFSSWAALPNPVIWHIHDYVGARPFAARLLRRFAGECAAVIANSNSVANDLEMTVPECRMVRTIHNAVDLSCFSPEGSKIDLDQLSNMPPASDGAMRIGLVATNARWKGHEVFIRAISLLPRDLNVRAYIIGDAVYRTAGSQYSREELMEMARRYGVVDLIGFSGFIKDTAAALRSLDIVVHASTQPEPFGLVIAEAMACGRAVLASRAGGVVELITDEVDGLLSPPGDAEEIAQKISRLANPGLRQRLGREARTSAVKMFHPSRLSAQLEELYSQVVPAALQKSLAASH